MCIRDRTTPTAIPQLPLQAVELDVFAQSDITQIFTWITLHISSLTSRFGMADDTRGECFVLDYPPSLPPVTVRRLIKGLGA